MITKTAWEAIGWDHGKFKIQGGRVFYEAVMYNCNNGGNLVKLARLEATNEGLKEVSRYVSPKTILIFDCETWPLN